MNTDCPVCSAEITFEKDTVVGEIIECPDCGTELEVKNIDPPKVDEAPMGDEDWGE